MIITRQQFRDRLPVASFPHWQDEAFEKKGCVKDHQLEMLMLLVNVAKKTSLTCFVRIEALRILSRSISGHLPSAVNLLELSDEGDRLET